MAGKLKPGKILAGLLIAVICAAVIVDLTVGPGDLRSGLIFATLGLGFISAAYVVIKQGLFEYVLKRLGESIIVLWLVVSLTFLLLRFVPGGPFDQEKALAPEIKANIEAKYGLNKPLPVQYLNYLGNLLKGDLGESFKFIGRPITEIIAESLPNSLQLGFYSLILAYIIGIPLGLFAASRHNTWWDTTSMVAAMSGVALPSFLVAPLLILFFCYWLEIFPPALWEGPMYFVLPVITLGVRPAAIIARLTRSSVLDVIHSDYIRTAKAKGLSHRVVLYKHVLKNSLLPVITISGPLVAGLLSGAFVIEVIFAIPGMGKHFVQSVTNRDYPLILGVTIVYAAMLVLMNLIVDLLYAIIDPRINLS